ncbi:Outer membrane protein HomA [Helicobacter pylori BM012A]|uniref:Outer membrane protein HomA n=1 Tax=Helicobacter pylori BM012S TaxID=1407463 RepID=V5NMU7_HELPX|nr:outer membrane protein HomA [Helicobacter pylori]AHA88362.1 Outer membrane protein HomA [Helicobacter pylori BM012A]AHA89935.1 Outer membrane protein HomA [Helicobacter pylori BM012S]AHZ28547.1 membrane protein [Helicobacter pylori]
MRKLFIPLLLFSALESNEKNGFFIEAGFETGLLEGTQTQEKRHTTTENTYATYNYLPTDTILKRAANLFTNAEAISKLKFSSLSPVRVLYMYNGQLTIENFLPYNLSNVKLSFTDAQGNVIDLGVIETIPKHSKIVLPGEAFDSLKIDPYTLFLPKIEATSTSVSDANTQRVFETLNKIKTNLVVNYRNENKFKDHENHWEAFTPQTAEEFTNLMLNMIAVLDSQSWGDAILNAPFEFTNKGGGGECDTSKENECVNPGTNGLVNSQNKSYVLNKQDIVNKFRNKADLDVVILKDSGVVGLGSDITPSNNDDGKHYGQLGVVASALDPKKLFGNDLKTINLADLRTILHEFSHTKGYGHNGNMTYQRVPTGQNENGKPKDSDGLPYNVCSLYGKSNQPAFPSNYPNSIYHNCADVPAGFLGVTAAVWQQLINQNALPINYANLGSQTNYNLNASLNTQDLANSMLSTIQKTFITSSVTNHYSSSASQSFRSPILGVNAKIGYQNYFNDFIGLAYYGIIKYNYAKAINQKVQQLSYGGGIDLLLDFITTYSNKNNPTGIQTRKNFSSSFGIFGGLRGLYNSYYVLNKVKGSGNLDVATGLNYRYKHSKYSVGISIPLIQRKASVVSSGSDYTNSFVFNEGASHFKVFFNYGWVF